MKHTIPLSAFIMRLREEGLLTYWQGDANVYIEDIQYDSRKVSQNTLFLCKGANFEPEYIANAKEAGAIAYLAVRPFDEGEEMNALIVQDIRKALAVVADVFFESPWKKLCMIAVTGTKGKSTTVTLLKAILDADARIHHEAMTGLTSSARVVDGKVDQPAVLTTPENIDLFRHLDNAVESGLKRMVVEVSSQALKYHRVGQIQFDHGVFLNIAPDHISDIEHPDFDDYFASKRMLFNVCSHTYINLNSEHCEMIREAAQESEVVTTFAVENEADYRALHVSDDGKGMIFDLVHTGEMFAVSTAMKGLFNVENALAAATVALSLGIDKEVIVDALAEVHLAGHMVYRHSDDGITVIVDYAHNDISFRKVFETVEHEFPMASTYCVFGSAGSKAQSRRADLGRVVDKKATRVYLVPDDPAKEKTEDINAEIAAVFKRPVPYVSLTDREAGIKDAILCAPVGAVVLLLGKGGEVAQKGPNGPESYEGDLALAEKYIEQRNNQGMQVSAYFR